MMLPYSGAFRLVSPYGERVDPITGDWEWHGGIDLVGIDSKGIRALTGGTILRSRMVTDLSNRTWEWGNYVSVLGDDGMTVYYCHLSERCAEAGERVEAGTVLGIEGSTGRSTGSHLHLEVRKSDASTVSAADYIGIANETGTYSIPEQMPLQAQSWSAEAVCWAKERGIILGDGTGDLMLDQACTREQMCVFLHRLYRLIKEGV